MKQAAQKILRSKGFSQSFITVVGNNIATGIAAISLIIISRILGPDKFGDFSVGVAIILILTKFMDLGISMSILKFAPKYSSKNKVNNIFSYTSKLRVIISAVVISSTLILAYLFLDKLNLGNTTIIYLAIILSLVIVLYDHFLSILQSLHLFSEAVLVNFIQAITKLIGIIIFAFFAIKNTTSIFFLYAASPFMSLLFVKKLTPSWLKLDFNKNFIKEKTEINPFIKHASIGILSIAVIENISILFTRHYLDAFETGLLGGVMRIAAVVLLTANSLAAVLYPRVAKYSKKSDLVNYIKKATLLSVAILASFVFFIPFSKILIQFSIGPEYMSGDPILLILTAASFVTMATVPFIALFFSFDAPWYFSITGLLQIAIVIAGNYIFVPLYGLEAAAVTSLTARVVILLVTVILGVWLYKKKE